MDKEKTLQAFIFKIHSTRLRKSNWNLDLDIQEAMKNEEIIPIASSTCLRWIDELNGLHHIQEKAKRVKNEIHLLHKSDTMQAKKNLKRLYLQLHSLQFKPDYLCLIIDKSSDYDRAYQKGFVVNGIRYCRLLATTGGVKGQTIVFTSERLAPILKKRIENGRNTNKKLVPAKYGAYESLVCSSSIPISDPKGILVVPDCEVDFLEDIIKLDDSNSSEPIMTFEKDYKIHKNASDGFGLMSPEQAKIWGEELSLGYIPSGLLTRGYAFQKGMLVTFDFHEFAKQKAQHFMVLDVWGNQVDIRNVHVILTASMLKLWDSYSSFEDYMTNCKENKYRFCITKICPEKLEDERNLNYQFIQSYQLDKKEIDALIEPTINEIYDVLGDDYRKSILFLRGANMSEKNADFTDFDYIKALQIDKRMADDPYVRTCIHRMIKKRIDQAKVGVIKVKGNFQIACGDPYSLCQSIFGMEITGLLKKGEFYSEYWSIKNVDTLACFRAPMTCHNNIRRLFLPNREDMQYWYQYIKTMIIFNSWDTTAEAENGEDFDGDQNLLTNHPILLKNLRNLPTILCVQRKAKKEIITEDLLVKANKNSFGDEIGIYTNGITAQFDIQACYKEDTREYKEMEYRIMCGQLFQQNAIDKTKGILAKPRPKQWFDFLSNKMKEDDNEKMKEIKEWNQKLTADKKPYFMQYIYPQVKLLLQKYLADSNKKCQTEFGWTIKELYDKQDKTEQETDFISYFEKRMPVGNHECVTNRICHRFEEEFDGYLTNYAKLSPFDSSILKSSQIDESSKEYTSTRRKIEKVYKEYCQETSKYQQTAKKERVSENVTSEHKASMLYAFRQECSFLCPKEAMLANIVIDLCYTTQKSKQFAWDMCGNVFLVNLLLQNQNQISYLEENADGDIEFAGKHFLEKHKYIGA